MNQRLLKVTNTVRGYAWGSPTAIPEALGTAPTGEPQAELWLGAHPGAPSQLSDGTGLDAHLAQHPELLAATEQLPFLMKLLAAASPLSLQVHPNQEQARVGFAREEASGPELTAPNRHYKDPNHKPEIIVAVTDFEALCGFRDPADTAEELAPLLANAPGDLGVRLLELLRLPEQERALREAFQLILESDPEIRKLVSHAVERAEHQDSLAAGTIRITAAHYGDDPGVLGATLLNRVQLAPGQALYLDAGNVHAYLSGFGIEAMAPSDNVLRGGLTPKHVDIAELLQIVEFRAINPGFVRPVESSSDGVQLTSYRPPAAEFSVHRVVAEGGPCELSGVAGPAMLIVVSGSLSLSLGDETLQLSRGESAFVAAGEPLQVSSVGGPAEAYLTAPGAELAQE